MPTASTKTLPLVHDVLAPDGSEVRILLSLAGGSMAHFRLPAGHISRAVRHHTVEEIWYILSGQGEMWRSADGQAETVTLSPATCLTIPVRHSFQFRCIGNEPLAAIAITMPPWTNSEEAEFVNGIWQPT
jgi:mannose-6-phosphate isomerase-like protein (cupin superfamily)